jgi:hypothetical protein
MKDKKVVSVSIVYCFVWSCRCVDVCDIGENLLHNIG